MERRKQKRLKLYLKADIIINGETHPGFIEDVSLEGMKYYVTTFLNTPGDFRPRKLLQFSFQSPSGEVIKLSGELIWFSRRSPVDKELTMGIRLVSPPKVFRELVASQP